MIKEKTAALVTCYNKAEFIVTCIEALAKCNEIDAVIVYDDASTDPSLKLLQSSFNHSNKVEILSGLTNIGVAESRNYLLTCTDANIIVLVDGDDIVNSLSKDRQIKAFRQQKNKKFCYSDYCRKMGQNVKKINGGKYSYGRLKTHNFIPFSSVLIRQSHKIRFEKIHHEDYLLWLQYLHEMMPHQVSYFEESTFTYNETSDSLSSNILKGMFSNFSIKRKVGMGIIEALFRTLIYIVIVCKNRWI